MFLAPRGSTPRPPHNQPNHLAWARAITFSTPSSTMASWAPRAHAGRTSHRATAAEHTSLRRAGGRPGRRNVRRTRREIVPLLGSAAPAADNARFSGFPASIQRETRLVHIHHQRRMV